MTVAEKLYHRFKRYRTLQTHHIHAMPLAILMPHSACNCRCVMCDIWKDNKNLKQLKVSDIQALLTTFHNLGTRQVVMSGGEALLNPNFFRFCELLGQEGIKVSLLSTGLTLEQHADRLIQHVNDITLSIDGDEELHDRIRNIPGAFQKLKRGVFAIRNRKPGYRITARTVIHKLNFRRWPNIIRAARELTLDQVSFLPADTTSHAFNREVLWSDSRQYEIRPAKSELAELSTVVENVIEQYHGDGFIAESPDKLRKIHGYYAAQYGLQAYPYKKCNAPWVSTVVEADGTVRPCFFHEPIGNIHDRSLEQILNGENALQFRKQLDTHKDPTCEKCVCYLHLSPGAKTN